MSPSKKQTSTLVTFVVAVVVGSLIVASAEAKLLRRSRLFDDSYDSPYGGAVATGERAIITVRGTRNPYDGSGLNKIAIEDTPYRGPYPRGVYDSYSGPNRMPVYPQDYGYMSNYGYGNGYNNGHVPMYGAPNRITVTGAYPIYGSRF